MHLPLLRSAIRSSEAVCLFAAAGPLTAQGQFVEKALELGLVHETVTGFDQMRGPAPDELVVLDWCQQGVTAGDIDGDGDPDLIASGGVAPNHVFRNDGGTFTDVTEASGLQSPELDRASYLGDFDGDGDLDLFVGALQGGNSLGDGRPKSRLYANDGSGHFEDVTLLAGTNGAGRSVSACWADLNKDGLLDLYVGEFHHAANRYYQNNGDGTFSERAAAAGIAHKGSAHAVTPLDSDADDLLDLFCAVDFDVNKLLGLPPEENYGSATFGGLPGGFFVDNSDGSGYAIDNAPMGTTVGDVDYDGDPDIYQSDIGDNPLFINHGWPGTGVPWERKERDYGIENGLVLAPGAHPGSEQKTSGWGVLFFDADHDPWLDLFVVNGHVAGIQPFTSVMQREQQNFFFQGEGPPLFTFSDETETYAIQDHIDDRGGALADVDGDGDLDLFVTPTVGRLRYYENQIDHGANGWVKVELEAGTSAPGGIGSVVRWTDSLGYPHTRWVGADQPTASQNDSHVHFGIGTESSIDLEVEFPSGMTLFLPGVTAGETVPAVEPEMIRLSARTLPIPMAALPGEPDTVTVTAFAHAPDGTPLDGNAVVTIDAAGLAPTGPVQHVAGNEFQRTFDVSTSPGPHPVTVSFDGWTVDIRPIVHTTGLMNPARSVVRVRPEAVRAGSGETFVVEVAPKDEKQLSVGPGHPVTITVPGLGQALATDHGDGTYSAIFSAPPVPGSATVAVDVQTFPLPGPAIEAAGPCDGAASDLELFVPLPAQSGTPHQLKVLFTPRDALGRRLGPGADVELHLAPLPATTGRFEPAGLGRERSGAGAGATGVGHVTPGPEPPSTVVVRSDLGGQGRDDGSFLFVLEKPLESTELPTGTIYLYVDGELVLGEPFDFDPTSG